MRRAGWNFAPGGWAEPLPAPALCPENGKGYDTMKEVYLWTKSRLFHFEGCDAGNGRGFALGHHPTAPSPYVTWACYDDKNGQRQYEWGHYGNDLVAMEQDFQTG